jgi:hypothetical protein
VLVVRHRRGLELDLRLLLLLRQLLRGQGRWRLLLLLALG